MLRELMIAAQEFESIIKELANLYSQEKSGVFKGEALLVSEKATLWYNSNFMRQQEAEEEKCLQQAHTQHKRDIAIMSAKYVAVEMPS